jgi:hypothetical protein
MKMAFNPVFYKKLVENSFYYAPPYLPVYALMLKQKAQQSALATLSVMDWEQGIKNTFTNFFENTYPEYDVKEAMKKIQKFIDS